MNFMEYLEGDTMLLTEGKTKNLHLEHLEDNVLNRGVNGARESIYFLQSLRDMLAGNTGSNINITTKWDGAPAIFVGTNPQNNDFFVGTKSIFGKNPKLNYTDADIDYNHPNPGLNNKLKTALAFLPKLNIKGVLQGDMMFTKGDLKKETIDGEKYITFQPNTIVYAVPDDSKLAKTMMAAQIGVVFHTSYSGKTLETMKASYNIDVGKLSMTKDVWFRDASFTDASGTATFTNKETKELTSILSTAGKTFQTIPAMALNRISASDVILQQIKTFNNKKVREGQKIKNTAVHVNQMIKDIEEKLNKKILEAKRQQTKMNRVKEKNEVLRFYRSNAIALQHIFDLMNLIVEAKTMIIRKLEKIKSIGTFIKADDGFKVTAPEGFVAIDRLKGNALKLVDRLEFSFNNFTVQKAWDK